ncbi:hypothetical protein K6L05_12440 [Salinicoccus roseus]|uniref:hypothetical protein n=1 Tax=Salinicoccus roseus TaxID=45670 RepID=UPI001CA78BB3|nr:hypothetical protein [Salinicoccus roseus]MBY8910575.1 hypothetical protein [Salinicoccus roseus]
MENKIMRWLSFIIGIFFFAFSIVIIDSIFYNGSFLDFPYILLTIYFFISTFTFPLVSLEAGEEAQDKNIFVRSNSLIVAYIIAPIWIVSKYFGK